MKHVDIYADGACFGNPGPGGYGAILIYKGTRRELFAGCASTTNNREELKGIIAALEALKEPCVVTVYSDSAYIVNASPETGSAAGSPAAGAPRRSSPSSTATSGNA